MLYTTLKFLHVLLAIIAIGFNSAYGLIIGRARKAGTAELKFALRTVKFMDDYVANPCYGLLLLTGVGMVHTSGYPWSLMWIHVLDGACSSWPSCWPSASTRPRCASRSRFSNPAGPTTRSSCACRSAGAMLGGILGLIVLVIVALMVYKPV